MSALSRIMSLILAGSQGEARPEQQGYAGAGPVIWDGQQLTAREKTVRQSEEADCFSSWRGRSWGERERRGRERETRERERDEGERERDEGERETRERAKRWLESKPGEKLFNRWHWPA